MKRLLSYRQARGLLLSRVPSPTLIEIPLAESLGRVLGRPILADRDLPPFRKAFMDGYALRCADLGKGAMLRVSDRIAAGSDPPPPLGPGEAAPIMTGAPVPDGADAVQMVEKTRRRGDTVEILEEPRPGQHIALQGEEVRRGEVVLEKGRRIGPAEVGVLASFGRTSVPVYKAPAVAVVSTGSELVEIGETPRFGQIRNSNAWMLLGLCQELGLDCEVLPSVPDDPVKIRETLEIGLKRDLLIFSGGVSMGELDYVHKVLAEEDVEIFFHKAAVKPGKPLIVGRRGQQMVFGLPGNPVSAFVTFEVFAKPAIRKWMGFSQAGPVTVSAGLRQAVSQKPGRLFFKPARTTTASQGLMVDPVETKGSADLVAFSRANSLLLLPADRSRLVAGSTVEVLLLGEPCKDSSRS